METDQKKEVTFTEVQSLKVISEMIQVSQKKLNDNGILFIVWGWAMCYSYMANYITSKVALTYNLSKLLKYSGSAVGAIAILFTIYIFITNRNKVQTYLSISLRYIWVSLFLSLVLINLIQFNVLHKINFELQHPIFMVVIAFAIVVTGGILRYRLLLFGGIAFALLAFISSYLDLEEQMLLEAIAWLIAFIIPGHLMYAKRK